MKDKTIATEAFSSGRKSFILDFRLAKNNSNYVRITNTIGFADGGAKTVKMFVWQEDLEAWISAVVSLLQSAAQTKKEEGVVWDLFHQGKDNRENGIKSWPADKRPREKFLEGGAKQLSLAELLAMLIGSGTSERNAIELSEEILAAVNQDLEKLSNLSHAELAKFKGVGLAKSSAILSALELGKRAFGIMGILGLKSA